MHGTLEEVWPRIIASDDRRQGLGVFVTVHATDFQGRRTENVVRTRALFADADGADQVRHCMEELARRRLTPNMKVRTGNGEHIYFLTEDVPLDRVLPLPERA